jgi:multidrug/hemolysin transport system permease protein
MTVFFSVMSPSFLILLFVLFLREGNANLIMNTVPGADKTDAYSLCDAWLFASVATMATFMSSLMLLTSFVDDRVTKRFSDYLVSPVRRWQLALGYVLSSVTVSLILTTLVMTIGQLWARLRSQPTMSGTQDLRAFGGVVIACLLFASLNTFVVTLTPSQGAFGGYAIIMGTSMGFMSFCYMPPATLRAGINSFFSAAPFAQTAALLRAPAMEPAISRVTDTIPDAGMRDTASQNIAHDLGMRLSVSGHSLSTQLIVVITLGLTVVLALLGTWRMGRVIR